MDKGLLSKAFIFAGLDTEELDGALSYLSAREVFYKKGQTLISLGSPITEFGVIASGVVQVSCDDINGNRMIMTTISRGDMFAESLAVTGAKESPIYATAAEDARVVWLKAEPIRRNIADSPLHSKIVANFVSAVAHKCLSMNDRVQILSKKTIREKVITYLSQLAEREKSSEFILPLDRQDMANYLGVERSALSRELSKMKDEGLISYRRNYFKVL